MAGIREEAGIAGFLSGVLRGFYAGEQLKTQRLQRQMMEEEQAARQGEQRRVDIEAARQEIAAPMIPEIAKEVRPAVRVGERLPGEMARRFHIPAPEALKAEAAAREREEAHRYRMAEIRARGEAGLAEARVRAAPKTKAEEPQTEDDFVLDQVKRWKAIGSIGGEPVEWVDQTSGQKMSQPPEFMEQVARYKWVKAQGGEPVTDQAAVSEVRGLNELNTFLATGQQSPSYERWHRLTGGKTDQPMFRPETVKRALPQLAPYVSDVGTYDLEDLARLAGDSGVPLEAILAALFGPAFKAKAEAERLGGQASRMMAPPQMQGAPETAAMLGE